MKVLFDNCTPPRLADIVGAYIAQDGHEAFHLRDLSCGRNASDLEWIRVLSETDEVWVVITGDRRIQKNKAERAAFRQASLRGFVLAPAFQKHPLNEVAASILWQWPSMMHMINLTQGTALYELSINRSSRFRALPL